MLLQRPAKYCLLVKQRLQPLPNRLCPTFCRLLSFLFLFHATNSLILCLKTLSVFFKNFPPFCARVMDVNPNPCGGTSHSHGQPSHSICKIQSPGGIQKNLKLQKQSSNVWNPPALFAVPNHYWPLPCTWCPKKDGSWRPCGDYCRLNLVTTHDMYPLPNMQDLSNSLHGCNFFLKINLVKGYHQIPVAATDIPKRQSSCHLACLSISSRRLGCLMLHKLFNA